MAVLVYMESARTRTQRKSVLYCEMMRPGKGVVCKKIICDRSDNQTLLREKLKTLECLLSAAGNEEGAIAQGAHIEVYSTDASVADCFTTFLSEQKNGIKSLGRNRDICDSIFRLAQERKYTLHFLGLGMLSSCVKQTAYELLDEYCSGCADEDGGCEE